MQTHVCLSLAGSRACRRTAGGKEGTPGHPAVPPRTAQHLRGMPAPAPPAAPSLALGGRSPPQPALWRQPRCHQTLDAPAPPPDRRTDGNATPIRGVQGGPAPAGRVPPDTAPPPPRGFTGTKVQARAHREPFPFLVFFKLRVWTVSTRRRAARSARSSQGQHFSVSLLTHAHTHAHTCTSVCLQGQSRCSRPHNKPHAEMTRESSPQPTLQFCHLSQPCPGGDSGDTRCGVGAEPGRGQGEPGR